MKRGIQFALLTALISGFSIFMGKIFISKMDPVVFTTLKNILVALVLSSIVLMPKMRSQLSKLTKIDWRNLVLIGIIGGSIPFALFFTGLATTSATGAAIIHKTLFVWVAILAILFLGEKLRIPQMIGYAAILWGVLWVSGTGGFGTDNGQLMILAATIFWAVENVIAKKTLKTVPFQIVAWGRMTIGSVLLLGLVVFQGKTSALFSLSFEQVQAVVIASLFLVGYVLSWYKALSLAPATIVSSILVLSTPITAALSALIITNVYPTAEFISTFLIVSGVLLIVWFALAKTSKKVTSTTN